MASALNWFEIPVSDMDRAVKFYNTILGASMKADPIAPGYTMAMLPSEDATGGALVQGEGYTPTTEGALIYLHCGDDLSESLGKIEGAGGKVLQSKTDIGEYGFMAIFLDTEGNRVALHSIN